MGPYELRSKLGEGGMGTVYRAWSAKHQREVALKLTKPGLAALEDSVRLVREGRLLAGIDHPFLVGFLDAGEHHGTPYLVMELVEGETLAQRNAREGRAAPADALRLARQLAAGLGELHRLGIVHRDLKPGNVLLDRRGSARITDLGLARGDALSRLTQTGEVVGTPAYMAPEQVQGAKADPACDVYALGVILFELLCGRLPFVDTNPLVLLTAHLKRQPARLRSLCPEASPELEALVACCLEKDPGDRYPHGAGVAAALGELGEGTRASSPLRLHLGLAVSAAFLGLAALGLAVTLRGGAPGEAPLESGSSAVPADRLAELLAEGERELALDPQQAEASFVQAVELHPDSAEAWVGWGRAAMALHAKRLARKRFVHALSLDAQNLRALLGMSLLHAESAEFDRAQDFLDQARRIEPESQPVRILTAQLELDRGRSEEARRQLEGLLAEDASCTDAARVLAEVLLREGRVEEAERVCQEALRFGPDAQLEGQLLYIALRSGVHTDELTTRIERALQRHPLSFGLLSCCVDVLLRRDRPQAAEPLLGRLLARYPESSQAYRLRSRLHAMRERWGLALADLEVVRQTQPDTVDLLKDGLRYAALCLDRERAQAFGEAWVELEPSSSAAWRQLGMAAVSSGDVPRALVAYQRSFELEPEMWAAAALALHNVLRADSAAAKRWADAGLERFPRSIELHTLRLGALLFDGDGKALDALQRIAAADSEAFYAHMLLARYHLSREDPEAAYPYVKHVNRLGQSSEVIGVIRGTHARQLGLLRWAAEAYEHALVDNPRSGEALCGLALVYAELGADSEALSLVGLGIRGLERSGHSPDLLDRAQKLAARLEAAGTANPVAFDRPLDELLRVGEQALAEQDHVVAQAAFRCVLFRDPSSSLARRGLCRIRGRRLFSEQAQVSIELALRLDGRDDPHCLVLASNLAFEGGDSARADALHAELEERFPDDPWTHYNRGELRWLRADVEGAVAAFERARERFPRSLPIARGLIAAYTSADRAEDALRVIDELEDSAALAFERGTALVSLDRREEALAAYGQALARWPQAANAFRKRGRLRAHMGQRDAARADYEASLAVEPLQAMVRSELAQLLFAEGRDAEARQQLQLAWNCARDVELPHIAVRVARYFLDDRRDVDSALAWIERGCEADPEFLELRALRGRAHAARGDLKRAEVDLSWVFERDPDDPAALAFYVEQAIARADRERADELSLRLLELDPEDWRGHTLRARALLFGGKTREAWANALRGAELGSDQVSALILVVMLGSDLGEWELVIEHGERLLALERGATGEERKLVTARVNQARERLAQGD